MGYLLKETGSEELLLAINKIVLHNEKYFYKGYEKEKNILDFKNAILTQREKDIEFILTF